MRQTYIQIHLSALQHNLTCVKNFAKKSKVLAMVKANAYGHGAVECLPALSQADALGVACLTEAIPLQTAGWQKPIVLMEGAFSLAEWQYAYQHQMQCVIHHQTQVEWALSDIPQHNNPIVWLKFNTGMNRLGFNQTEILDVAKQLFNKGYSLILTSHFANADNITHPLNQTQIQLFHETLNLLKSQISLTIQGSLCNSAGIVNWQTCHYDWVRAGIMLYGSSPVIHQTASDIGLKPVMTFSASIMAIHQLNAGESVGYGSRWQAKQPCKIGIVSVGYGDGYPRVIHENAYMQTEQGERLPIIGRVAMDMLMIDISHAVHVDIGTTVQLWGDMPTIDEVASWNDTISYELLCLVTNRPTWQYR